MVSISFRRGLLAILSVLLIIAATATLASTTADASEMCAGNGGSWHGDGDSNTDGQCTLPVNSPMSLEACGDSPNLLYTYWSANTMTGYTCKAFDVMSVFKYGIDEAICGLAGGEYSESVETSAVSCTVTHTLFGDCSGTTIYSVEKSIKIESPEITITCSGGAAGGSGGNTAPPKPRTPGHGKFGNGITDDGSGSANLGGNKNGWFYYNEGTCAGSCSVGANLPKGAKNSKPDGTNATLYVRMVDAEGNPSNGSYTVCFDPEKLGNDAVIYRYISGVWVAQPAFNSGGLVCTTASGDGAFALAK